eukprot:5454947-Heterocapsa_arctica.AAC.1
MICVFVSYTLANSHEHLHLHSRSFDSDVISMHRRFLPPLGRVEQAAARLSFREPELLEGASWLLPPVLRGVAGAVQAHPQHATLLVVSGPPVLCQQLDEHRPLRPGVEVRPPGVDDANARGRVMITGGVRYDQSNPFQRRSAL